jgi:hypothetical protein
MPREIPLRHILPAEPAVLLLLGGRDNDDEIADALRSAIDWQTLLALAVSERAGAELHRHVRQRAEADVPPEVRDALQRMAMVAEFEMTHLHHCLDGALAALGSLDARVMLLKGTALVHAVYGGDYARRPMGDIDLLVDVSRAGELQQAFLAAGRWQETVGADRVGAYREHHHLPPLRDARGSSVHLELHTALFPHGHPFGLTPELLWAHAQPLPAHESVARDAVAGSFPTRGVYLPAIPHQLLHVCLHFAWSHLMRFGAWRTFRDVSAVVSSGRVDWDAFVTLARETRAASCCYWTFRLAKRVARVPVPPEVIRALRPPRPEAYLRGLERHYVRNLVPSGLACPSVRVDRALWNLGMVPALSGFGDVRPWDRDTHFIRPGAATGAHGAPAGRATQFWRTIHYL